MFAVKAVVYVHFEYEDNSFNVILKYMSLDMRNLMEVYEVTGFYDDEDSSVGFMQAQ